MQSIHPHSIQKRKLQSGGPICWHHQVGSAESAPSTHSHSDGIESSGKASKTSWLLKCWNLGMKDRSHLGALAPGSEGLQHPEAREPKKTRGGDYR